MECDPSIQDEVCRRRAQHLQAAGDTAAESVETAVAEIVRLVNEAKSESTRLRAAESLLAFTGNLHSDIAQEETNAAMERELAALTASLRSKLS